MLKEKSAGAVVFRKEKDTILYLLLYKKPHNHYKESWDFPKGWVEDGEDEHATAEREIEEEVGIQKVTIVPDFKERVTYFYEHEKGKVSKEVIWFLAETPVEEVTVSFEHAGHGWFTYEEALEKTTFATSKDVLKKAHAFLEN